MSGFKFRPMHDHGQIHPHFPDLVYLFLRTGENGNDIHGYVTDDVLELIQAAPALYEALKVAEEALRTCYEVDNFDDSSQHRALDKARAALAKVTGEEK